MEAQMPARTADDLARRDAILRHLKIDMTAAAERGPAKDALIQMAGTFGVDVADDASLEEVGWEISDKVCSLARAASAEDVLEAMGAMLTPPPAPPEDEGARDQEPPAPAARTLPDFESPEAQDAWTSDVMGELRSIFGEEAGVPADLLDGLRASAEAFKTALGGGGAAGPDDGAPAEGMKSLRSQVGTLEGQVKTLVAERDALRRQDLEREIDDTLQAHVREAGQLEVAGEELADLREHCLVVSDAGKDWRPLAQVLAAGRQAPPAGTALDPRGRTAKRGGSPGTADEASEATRTVLLSEHPDKYRRNKRLLRRDAYARAKAEHPRLFGRTPADDGVA
jgi:hypothetical protein